MVAGYCKWSTVDGVKTCPPDGVSGKRREQSTGYESTKGLEVERRQHKR